MGGQRFAAASSDVFEPADPARTMPKGLVIGAIAAVVLLIALMSWLNQRSLEGTDEPVAAAETNTPAATAAAPAQAPAPAAAQGPVVLTATAPVWFQVSERGGATLFSGLLQPGQTYTVPATAAAPVLKTGKPEALRINVGTNVAGPVGPAATTVSNVSLLAADLLKTPAAAQTNPPPTTLAPPQQPARPRARNRSAPAAAAPQPVPEAAPPPAPATTTNNAQ